MCLRVNACACACLAMVWWTAVGMVFYIPVSLHENAGPVPFPAKIAVFVVCVLIFFGLPPGAILLEKRRRAMAVLASSPTATLVQYRGPQPTAPPLPEGGAV